MAISYNLDTDVQSQSNIISKYHDSIFLVIKQNLSQELCVAMQLFFRSLDIRLGNVSMSECAKHSNPHLINFKVQGSEFKVQGHCQLHYIFQPNQSGKEATNDSLAKKLGPPVSNYLCM